MNISEKIFSLRKKLHDHNYRYYVLDDPLISDYDFDMLLKELEHLENENPEYFDINSPKGLIVSISLKPHSVGTVYLFSAFAKCLITSFAIFIPVASSIPSVPGDEFTSNIYGGWLSLFLLGIKSTAVQ